VINVDMETFTSVYNNQAAGDGGRMYIVDAVGDVIAANDAGMAGSRSPSLPILHAERASESFVFTSGGIRMRAYSYRLSTPLGLLVNEIPEGLITRNIMTLRFIVLLMFCVSLLLAFGLSRFWLFRLMRPFRELMIAIRSVGQGNLGVTITDLPGNELGTLMRQFNMMSSNIKDLFNQKVKAEAEKRDLEMETLRSQINPHFIYNTLNNIKWMAMIDQKKTIADCLTTFTSFLEVVLREHEPTCTLREELNHLNNYIKIMNFRFGGGLELASDISEEFLDCRVVRFMLQPIVENSVVHGLEQQLNGVIRITVDRLGDDVTISVVDNGKGIEPLPLKHLNQMLQEGSPASEAGIGLANVSKRLRLHFGPHSSIRVSSEERDGTVVTLTMPFVR
jgi:sensor histidine kinase YesM